MGRMSKFTFPLPGRKHRPTPPVQSELAYAPKAQQLLGSTALDLDRCTPTQWDEASNSGISISVSESTASHHPSDRGLGARNEVGAASRSQWDQESETVPTHLQAKGPTMGYHAGNDTLRVLSDVSSLREKQSSSTIMSYYDKTIVPLSVSQQTSASAMAKGLPTKANALLDIDGTMSQPTRQTTPAKRNIGNFLSKTRASTSRYSVQQQDYDVTSRAAPPLSPASPNANRSSDYIERRVTRKSTRERLYGLTGRGSRKPNPVPEPSSPPKAMQRDGVDLNHLYDHYEQMSFKQVIGKPDVTPEELAEEADYVQELISHESVTLDIHPPNYRRDTGNSVMHTRGTLVPDTECSASISSRHTRTSKASKKTSSSFVDSDLHQRSVLSLSSDSEDDGYVEQPKPSPRAALRSRIISEEDDVVLPMSEKRRSTASKSSANSGHSGVSGRRAPFAPRTTYLAIPNEPLPPRAPEVARRTSSLAHRASPAPTPASSIRSSRVSTSTIASASQHLQDARSMTRASPATRNVAHEDERRGSAASHASSVRSTDQASRPLSPSSVEFYVRPPSGQDPRLMAVTKQEEMLLSALRLKRARMRDNTLAGLEEEDGDGIKRRDADDAAVERDPGAYSAPVRAIRKKGSKSSVASTVREQQLSHANGGTFRPVAWSTAPQRALPPLPAASSSRRVGGTSRKKLSLNCAPSAPGAQPERVLLYLDGIDTEEPSGELSDFIGIDDSGSDGRSSQARGSSRSGTDDRTPVTPSDLVPSPSTLSQGAAGALGGVRVVQEDACHGVPRADSPVSPLMPIFDTAGKSRKAARLSAVGGVGMEASWWGDDG